ncbi:thioredoxin domain-containing protein [Spirosoma areae]
MKSDDLPNPILLTPQSAVLLIFMPHKWADHRQQASLTALADSLKVQFGGLLRVLRIDEATHPDVVRSFAIIQTPAFVLVRRGIELWRHEGMADESTFMLLIERLLTEKSQ